MSFDKLRIIKSAEKALVEGFESKVSAPSSSEDEFSLDFLKNWSAPWREESLNHYLNLGWSMGYFDGDQLEGYILVQPILFFKGQTQSLWIESVRFNEPQIGLTLWEAIVKLAREKHIQQVMFDPKATVGLELKSLNYQLHTGYDFHYVKTTKWEEF